MAIALSFERSYVAGIEDDGAISPLTGIGSIRNYVGEFVLRSINSFVDPMQSLR